MCVCLLENNVLKKSCPLLQFWRKLRRRVTVVLSWRKRWRREEIYIERQGGRLISWEAGCVNLLSMSLKQADWSIVHWVNGELDFRMSRGDVFS